MEARNYLRLAMMFENNNASTFSKNLEKMICLILFEKKGKGLLISEIIYEIKRTYALTFSDREIINVIKKEKQNKIVCIEDHHDYSLNKYSITPDENDKIKTKTDLTDLQSIISNFLSANKQVEITFDEMFELLTRYFYDLFNSNADTILALMNKGSNELKVIENEYTDDQKEIINAFIYWANDEKNKYIYNMLSCCFDYCIMTVKKDKAIYTTIFNNKIFFLDTNIIFRIMGLNNKNRKEIIESFLTKCKEVGITISYTNFTKKELEDTISYYVNQIKSWLMNATPISVESIMKLDGSLSNSDFYAEYFNWCNKPGNKVGDYESFKKSLLHKAYTILSSFKFFSHESYDFINNEFEKHFESLRMHKYSLGRNSRDSAIKVDVNNYYFIRELNKSKNGEDFFSVNNFLISADHALGSWEKELRPGSIPTIVLPSVWYSIILQYTGRTDDDYLSFSRFLTFSFSDSLEFEDPRKLEILKKVLLLNDTTEIKEKTIFDISEKLQKDYKNLESDEIVEISHKYIIDQKIAEVTEQANQDKEKAIEEERNRAQTKYDIQKQEYELSLKKLNDEKEDKEKELLNVKQRTTQEVENATKTEFERIVNKESKERAKKKHRFYWILTILFVIIFIVGLVTSIIYVIKKTDIDDQFQFKFEMIWVLIDILFGFITNIIFKYGFKKNNYDEILKKEKEKVNKKYS